MGTAAIPDGLLHIPTAAPAGKHTPERQAGDRTIRVAALASLAVHLALLIAWLPASLNSNSLVLMPNLFVWIEQPADRDIEHHTAAALQRPATNQVARDSQTVGTSAAEHKTDADPVERSQDSAPASRETTETEAPVQSSVVAHEDNATLALDAPAFTAATDERDDPEDSEDDAATDAMAVLVSTSASTDSSAVDSTAMRPRERRMLAKRIDKLAHQLLDDGQSSGRVSWRYKKRRYSAHVRREAAASDMGFETVVVEITTIADGQALQTRVQLRRLAFSHFTQLVDHWDPWVQLHDDEVAGRFHSNSELVLGWDDEAAPRFNGLVTTSSPGYSLVSTTGTLARRDVFRGGIETGTRRISLPQSVLFNAASPKSRSMRTHHFERDTQITFDETGAFTWRTADGSGAEHREATATSPLYLSAGPGTMLYVQGVVRGVVLVYSPKRIVITGSLRYARDPRRDPDAGDYLGLVSAGNIVIAGIDEIEPGDLAIDAAIYARGRFLVSDVTTPQRATLSIYGSLSAGSLGETEPRYATHIKFDQRFERVRPPGFPLTNRYEVTSWDEQWQPIDERERE